MSAALEIITLKGRYFWRGDKRAATTPRKCIRRNDPPASYTASLLQHYFKTLDVMSQYKNTLGVLAANVLVNNHASEACVPVIAAVVRGMKQYMRLKADATGQRILPVGYAAAASDDRNLALENSLPGFSPKSWSSESKSFGSKSSASAISQAVDVDVGLLLLGEVNVARSS
ncbi:1,3-beta-glucanosyltransferase-like protein [Zymoseptoria tritici IPO323]|uniref:1,3-beta-glucanosyltransferase n=1 Tax=Zymoseptoria tritici (strain CBS 115943 / IPO323) TaxID=336722 RepID=F9X6U6_ZYMTI|nr:1,3-beta-glucanosyltransferase-like protein [Zymoseptoria tritici IPO323]EGP88752.1 1,3-beta-glucanosyltransferase-like protein [Zymoseptoria tritici IPO323]